jgi:hypothetical protein
MTKDREDEERKISERLWEAVHSLDTCDHCNWVVTSASAYEKHLSEKHPKGGKV